MDLKWLSDNILATAVGTGIGALITVIGSYFRLRAKIRADAKQKRDELKANTSKNDALYRVRETEQVLRAQQALIKSLMERVSALEAALFKQKHEYEQMVSEVRESYDKRIAQLEHELKSTRQDF